MGAYFTMIDMTDYEYNFCGANEIGNIPMSDIGRALQKTNSDPDPITHIGGEEVDRLETFPLVTTSKTRAEL